MKAFGEKERTEGKLGARKAKEKRKTKER